MADRLIEVDGVSKEYRLGVINHGTLHDDLTSWFAQLRGKEDPNTKLGYDYKRIKNNRLMALDNVSFTLDRGDTLSVIGRNGAGKSTLLKLISRITSPSAGEIRIRGQVASMLEVGTGFHPDLTGRDNVYLNGAIMGMRRSDVTAKLKEIIEFSEVGDFIDTPVKRYSSGMYVKLGFAVAASLAPDILICDEVLAVGDQTFQQKCISKMRDVARDGRAVIYVSHNMRTVAELCNRGIFLDGGRLLYDGTTEHCVELYSGKGIEDLDRDLSDMPRPKRRGDLMRMQRMQIMDTRGITYEMDTSFRFKLTGLPHIDDSHLQVRVMLYSSMAAPIAMSQCAPFPVKKEEPFTVDLRMPLDGLAPAEYTIKISILSADGRGSNTIYDTIMDVGHIIISDDPSKNGGYKWRERLWGNYRMKDMELL